MAPIFCGVYLRRMCTASTGAMAFTNEHGPVYFTFVSSIHTSGQTMVTNRHKFAPMLERNRTWASTEVSRYSVQEETEPPPPTTTTTNENLRKKTPSDLFRPRHERGMDSSQIQRVRYHPFQSAWSVPVAQFLYLFTAWRVGPCHTLSSENRREHLKYVGMVGSGALLQ